MFDLVGLSKDYLERYPREANARVERIVSFAEGRRCRHAQVAEHFGETFAPPCGACDGCDPSTATSSRGAAFYRQRLARFRSLSHVTVEVEHRT